MKNFKKESKTLMQHQVEMVEAMRTNAKGILQAPTGSGKTLVQAEVASDYATPGFKVVVVSTPRIALSNQVANEYLDYFAYSKMISPTSYNTILVHSGNAVEFAEEDMTLTERKALLNFKGKAVTATSFTSEFVEKVQASQKEDKPLFVFTTYHSTKEKVAEVLNAMGVTVACHLNDEAHYLTTEKFSQIFEDFRPQTQYFFTATPITSESAEGRGMNNTQRFGEMIFKMNYKEAVDKGLILDINVRMLTSRSNLIFTPDEVKSQIGDLVDHAFAQTEEEFPGLGAKMLVAAKDSNQIRTFLRSDEFADLRAEGVEIFTVHSNKDVMTHNGEVISRKVFDKKKDVMGKDPSVKMVIVHYDILSEGIDIPGLLNVLILRQMTTAKFMQTVGRVVRLYRANPELKKRGLVMFPDISDKDMMVQFKNMIQSLIKDYGYSAELLREMITKGAKEDNGDDIREKSNQVSPKDVDLMLGITSLKFKDIVNEFE